MHHLLASLVSDEKLGHLSHPSFVYSTTLSPVLPLVFCSLIMMYLGMDFFEFVLFGIYELLKSVSLSSTKSGTCQDFLRI